MSEEIEKQYNPKLVEDKWYKYWQEKKYFKATVNPDKKPYTIMIPPPNVTAALHMGHAYNNTVQDIIIRWKRMQGFEALYQPGTDHAGIATQTVVERELAKEGLTKYDLGREKFIKRVWEWRETYGSKIIEQLKKLGISADWDRTRFTMDEGLSDAVNEVFIKLYNKGLIYKGHRIVNWDPVSETALADDEVEHSEEQSKIYHIRYKLENSDKHIVVATTRPETLFGDTAVAIAPDDEHKKHLIGKTVIIPFVNRSVPIIVDEHVDKNFGSGFVKVTPAHDPNDFEIGERHSLDQILVLDKTAKVFSHCKLVKGSELNDELAIPKRFAGLDRYVARKLIIKELESQDMIEAIKDHTHTLGKSYRSNAIIEPYLSEQWFVKMKPLATRALEAVKSGKIKIYPKNRYEKTYEHWMLNIKDWCISRQLWWGHRIPIWYNKTGQIIASKNDPSTPNEKWQQDTDVLDTWFSSWLWPFSTLGWPNETDDLKYFYPSNTLVTASDIIFFWVARMIMAGLEFMDKIPFENIYFNGIVRDSHGKKMSKSAGNGIDPLDVIDQFSTDAVRYTVIQLSSQGQDIKLSEKDFEMGRNFSNKIWNSFRFLQMNLANYKNESVADVKHNLEMVDKWILFQLDETKIKLNNHLEQFRFQDGLADIYTFLWNDYCDWYLESIKIRLYNSNKETEKITCQAVAVHCLKQILICLHPFLPFISEEIWQKLKNNEDADSITITEWPSDEGFLQYQKDATQFEEVKDLIISIRNMKAEMNLKSNNKPEIFFSSNRDMNFIEMSSVYIKALAGADLIVLKNDPVKEISASSLINGIQIQIPLAGNIDIDFEKDRIQKEINKKERNIQISLSKLSNELFIAKAPKNIIDLEKIKLKEIESDLIKLKETLKQLD